jgi:outer membrane protein TolC
MSNRSRRLSLLAALGAGWLCFQSYAPVSAEERGRLQIPENRREAAGGFSGLFGVFPPESVPPPALENSPRVADLIRNGTIELSVRDALALALENNLNIAIQRYVLDYSRTDLMRSRAGQSPRGFTGSSTPGGLTAGALGAGLSGSGAGSGVGSAGGITGGGGAIQVGSSGSFDPSLSFSFSYDHVTSPLNTNVVSGIYDVTGETTAFSASYAQLFSLGTSYSLTLSGQKSSTTQQNLRFNPTAVTRFAIGVNQPLLNGFGRLYNKRYIMVAENNTKVADIVFRQQIIDTVVSLLNAYWDLAAMQQSVRVAEQSLAVAEELLRDNRTRLDIGTMSPLDVISAESEVAARTRDLTVARTTLQLEEATLKNMLAKHVSSELDAARIALKDPMPEPGAKDIPDLEIALANALGNRPELKQADINQTNQDISVRFTRASLKPSLSIFGFYAGSGLQGTATGEETDSGIFDALGQSFRGEYPEYAAGFGLSLPIRNRTAQADNLRSQLEANQMRIDHQRTRNTISMEVQKAIIGLIQGKAQVEAARKASALAREIWEGEQVKLQEGASTSYQVILRERDYASARYAEVGAMINYAKAMVEMDRAGGMVLEQNGISYDGASGEASASRSGNGDSGRNDQ